MPNSEMQPTVLVVDHDVWQRTYTTDTLARQGFAVLGASNGASGLRKAEQHVCDAIVVDLALPEVTGVEFIQRLKAMDNTRSVPVIVIGDTPPDELVPASGCMPKPLKPEQMISEVDRCLHTWRMRQTVTR